MKHKEIIESLNKTYDLDDLNKEDIKKISALRHKINKYVGMMSLRNRQKNIIMDKIRGMIR